MFEEDSIRVVFQRSFYIQIVCQKASQECYCDVKKVPKMVRFIFDSKDNEVMLMGLKGPRKSKLSCTKIRKNICLQRFTQNRKVNSHNKYFIDGRKIFMLQTFPNYLRGHSKTTLKRRGRWEVGEMSRVRRSYFIKVRKIL